MRRVTRAQLEADVLRKLEKRQVKVNRKHAEDSLDNEQEWKTARKTRPLQTVLAALKGMMGARERCMYCLDSHGTDIEHFWPKTPYPEKIEVLPNNFSVYFQYLSAASIKTALFINRLGLIFLNQPPFP